MSEKITVREFIEIMKTKNQDAFVRVVEHTSGRGYYDQGGWASEVFFDPSKHIEEFVDDEITIGRYDG